eukprot:5175848-Prymnesium_polylepis.2
MDELFYGGPTCCAMACDHIYVPKIGLEVRVRHGRIRRELLLKLGHDGGRVEVGYCWIAHVQLQRNLRVEHLPPGAHGASKVIGRTQRIDEGCRHRLPSRVDSKVVERARVEGPILEHLRRRFDKIPWQRREAHVIWRNARDVSRLRRAFAVGRNVHSVATPEKSFHRCCWPPTMWCIK